MNKEDQIKFCEEMHLAYAKRDSMILDPKWVAFLWENCFRAIWYKWQDNDSP